MTITRQGALSLAAAACLLLYAGCANTGFKTTAQQPELLSGTIETREIRVGSKIGGRVTEVLVEEGQTVRSGQVIARFDIAELVAEMGQAEAAVQQQVARLERLERGARSEEIAQARAFTASARAVYESIRNGPRPEEVEQGRASLAAAEAEAANAELIHLRTERLYQSGDCSRQDAESARFRLDHLRARRDAIEKQLDLLLNGSRAEDVRAAEERYRQAREAERLILAGPRGEEIAEARAQLIQAQARLEQIRVRIAEGEVRAPADAVVEAIAVRPGDLLTPNQNVARLLERNQLFVRVYVAEPRLGRIRVGQPARIRVDSFTDRTFAGLIEQVNSQGEFTPRNVQSRDERNHQVFGVKVRIDNRDGRLKSGMAADVALEAE